MKTALCVNCAEQKVSSGKKSQHQKLDANLVQE